MKRTDVNKGVGKLDFTEIPRANEADGRQDTFELFAREFFTLIGFQIIEDPNRGQDAGCDLIVSEKREGVLGTTEIKWLVSCKHKAHSTKSVLYTDEEDIPGRVEQHHCNGFIGFYSTVCSAPLYQKITSYKDRFEVEVFDNAKIESYIDKLDGASGLLKRFFPRSYQKLQEKNYDEYKGMIKVYARTLQEYRKNDLYEFVKVWNWLYSYCIENLSETCSEELIDNAYYLGDICDYISEYSKASELAQRIIDIIKGKDPKDLSNHHIRLLIGCNYSLFIAKTGEPSEKQKKLNRAEDEMRHIKEILDNRCWDNETDKYFINSLYTSDYAALLMNEAALERERGEEKKRQSILKTALEYHIDSLNARDHILKANSFTDETGSRENVLRYYYKSKSNIASVHFQLGSYDEAIKLHKDVLKHRIAEKEKSNAFITKSYIVGCYVKKAELKQLNVDELEECTSYIHECELFYKNNNDRIRLDDIKKKREQFEKLRTEVLGEKS